MIKGGSAQLPFACGFRASRQRETKFERAHSTFSASIENRCHDFLSAGSLAAQAALLRESAHAPALPCKCSNLAAESMLWMLRYVVSAAAALLIFAAGSARSTETGDPPHSSMSPIEVVASTGHAGEVRTVAISPDSKYILSGGDDKTIKLWSVVTGRLIRTFKSDGGAIYTLTFSPDGLNVVSGGNDQTIKVWDTITGKLRRTIQGHLDGVHSIRFSPDGRNILSGGDDSTLRLWDIASGRLIRTFRGHSNGVQSVAFSPDGRVIVSGAFAAENDSLKLWNASTGRLIRTLALRDRDTINSVAFSPNGRKIASGGDHNFVLWDAASGKPIHIFKEQETRVFSLAFSPDGSHILTGDDKGGLKLWDASTGRLVKTFAGDVVSIYSVAFALDGKHVVSGGNDPVLKLWDVSTAQVVQTFQGHNNSIVAITISGDSKILLSKNLSNNDRSDSTGTMKTWDLNTGRLLQSFIGYTYQDPPVSLSPDGLVVAAGSYDGTFELRDAATGRGIRVFNPPNVREYVGKPISLAFSPDGGKVLSGYENGKFRIWESASGRLLKTIDVDSLSVAFTVSPDGLRLMTYSFNGMKLWDMQSGQILKEFPIGPFKDKSGSSNGTGSIDFSRDGRTVLTGGGDINNDLMLWDVESGLLLREFPQNSHHWHDYRDRVISVALSPDGRTALSGGGDGQLKLWDISTGDLLSSTYGEGEIRSVVFSPDGEKAVSGDVSGRIQVISVREKKLQASIISSGPDAIVMTPEGFFDSTSRKAAQLLTVVRGLEVYNIDQVYNQLYRPDLVREKLAGDPKGIVRDAAAKMNLDMAIGSGAPPDVKIAASSGNVSASSTNLEATVTDAGGGIGKVEWRVNGVTQGIDQGGVARDATLQKRDDPKPPHNAITLRRNLSLEPGANKIEVIAYNAEGLISSNPVGLTIERKTDQVADRETTTSAPRLFVLAVGINDYFDGRLRLAYAVPDAKALAEGFKQAGAGLYSSVEVTTLLNQDVTMDKLDATFVELGARMKPTDVFVFFIAGHGKTVDGHYHFIPYNFRYQDARSIVTGGIDQDHFQTWLSHIPARKSLMLTDTCESGSLTEDPMRVASRGLESVEAQNAAIELLMRAVGRTVLSASTDDAPALEGYRGHGVFSYAVLDALAHAQAGQDGFITVTSLAGFVDQRVQDVSYKAFHIRQIPQMKVVGSNFPIAHRLATSLVSEDGAADAIASKASDGAAIAAKPTHVVIAAVTVRATADLMGVPVTELPPGAQVTLVQTANGWTVIAREGRKLGYVKADTLVRLQ